MKSPRLRIPESDQKIFIELLNIDMPEIIAALSNVDDSIIYYPGDFSTMDSLEGRFSNEISKVRVMQILRESIYSAISHDIDISDLKNQLNALLSSNVDDINRSKLFDIIDLAEEKFGKSAIAFKMIINTSKQMGGLSATVSEKPIFDDYKLELLGYMMVYNIEFNSIESGNKNGYSIELDYSDLVLLRNEIDLLFEKHELLKSRYKGSKVKYFRVLEEDRENEQ